MRIIFLHMLNRDEKIVASIARIGFPVAPVVQKTSKKRKTVRAVALGVMFLQRARYVGLSHLPCIALIYSTAFFTVVQAKPGGINVLRSLQYKPPLRRSDADESRTVQVVEPAVVAGHKHEPYVHWRFPLFIVDLASSFFKSSNILSMSFFLWLVS